MFMRVGGIDEDIIKVNDYTSTYEGLKNIVRDSHECAWGI
jgi:hypothetical protein